MMVAKGNRRSPQMPKDNIPLEKLAQHYEAFNKSEAKSEVIQGTDKSARERLALPLNRLTVSVWSQLAD